VLKSSVYVALVRPRGGPGSNRVLVGTTNIAVCASIWALIARNAGGVGRHWPTAVPPVNGGELALNPPVARHPRTACAPSPPHPMPPPGAWPASSAASAASPS